MQPIPPLPTPPEILTQAANALGVPVTLLIGVCAIVLVSARDWRLVLAALMTLYIGLALITATYLPPEWALLRVVVGGLIAIMWYLSAQRAGWGGRFLPFHQQGGVQARPLSSTTLFRTLLAVVLAAALLIIRPRLPIPTVDPDIRLIFTWLAAFGLLGLALGEEAMQSGVALLMWMAATQLLLSSLARDPWLIWFLSSTEILIGLAIAYLIVARGSQTQATLPESDAG
ncbi:MAG: hypothetical protein KDI03_06655 [Anaerolineae bacterium]|nr:hypothetical protein [Anaerolineae bacterium]MCB0199739.1 hypothetical protein [Anaerolineae bacterium]MCB0204319.1 hypothetical protein [Anaerolineae bacterium]